MASLTSDKHLLPTNLEKQVAKIQENYFKRLRHIFIDQKEVG